MENVITKLWKNYRHRFVPWMAVNIRSEAQRKVVSADDNILADEDLLCVLMKLTSTLNDSLKKNASTNGEAVMTQSVGYSIKRSRSTLPNAGIGVVLSSGSARRGDLIAFYPGTLYRRFEPLFLPSLGNQFILRCKDGIHIDGNDCFLSKTIYKSCVNRDSFGQYKAADISWITKSPIVPWNIGQYVNNGTNEFQSNVAYQEFDIHDFPPELDYLLPNIWYSGSRGRHIRIVGLIATKTINTGDEILSNYVTLVHDS